MINFEKISHVMRQTVGFLNNSDYSNFRFEISEESQKTTIKISSKSGTIYFIKSSDKNEPIENLIKDSIAHLQCNVKEQRVATQERLADAKKVCESFTEKLTNTATIENSLEKLNTESILTF